MAISTANQNVYFKKGSQANFDKIENGKFIEGSFYLTDVGRLYYANGTSKNDVLLLSSNIEALTIGNNNTDTGSYLSGISATTGSYYYVTDRNVLVYYDGVGGVSGFHQINTDTYLVNNDAAVTVSNVSADNKSVDITTTVQDTTGLSPLHTATGHFKLKGGNNITFSSDTSTNEIIINNNLVNTDTTYTFKPYTTTDGVYLSLQANGGSAQNITLKGAGGISLNIPNQQKPNEIVVEGVPAISDIDYSVNDNGVFTTTISQGASQSTSTTFQPVVQYGPVVSGTTTTYDSSATFENSGLSNISNIKLDVYNKTQIDALIEQAKGAIDAMTYKGLLTTAILAQITSSTTPTNNNRGDTYKASADITYTQNNSSFTIKKGDLLIFKGNDGEQGIYNPSVSSDLNTLEIIESGNEQLLNISATTSNNQINFTDALAGAGGQAIIGQVRFTNNRTTTANANINLTTRVEQENNNDVIKVNIEHGAPGIGKALISNGSSSTTTNVISTEVNATTGTYITGIESIERDAQGHITSATFQKYLIKDTNPTITAQSVMGSNNIDESDNNASIASLTFGYQLEGQDNFRSSDAITMNLKSSTLSVTATGNGNNNTNGPSVGNYRVDLLWGTF